MGFKGHLLVGLDTVFLRQLVEQGGEADRFLRQLQARLLQLGDGQNLFGQAEQVGTLFVQDGEVLFLQFGVLVQQATSSVCPVMEMVVMGVFMSWIMA